MCFHIYCFLCNVIYYINKFYKYLLYLLYKNCLHRKVYTNNSCVAIL